MTPTTITTADLRTRPLRELLPLVRWVTLGAPAGSTPAGGDRASFAW